MVEEQWSSIPDRPQQSPVRIFCHRGMSGGHVAFHYCGRPSHWLRYASHSVATLRWPLGVPCRLNNICFQLAPVADDFHWCSNGSQWCSKVFPWVCTWWGRQMLANLHSRHCTRLQYTTPDHTIHNIVRACPCVVSACLGSGSRHLPPWLCQASADKHSLSRLTKI